MTVKMSITLLLLTLVASHMHMTSPEPKFLPGFQYDKPAPSMICDLVPYASGSGTEVIPAFNAGLESKGFKSLKEYVDACASKNSVKVCGNTIPASQVPFPQDNTVKIDIGADHIGPSEIWVDDKLVMTNKGIDGATIKKTPPSSPVDFASLCPSGSCQVRFVMAALHLSPAELYDNCVTITGTPSQTVIGQRRNQVEITSYPSPEPTTTAPPPNTGSPPNTETIPNTTADQYAQEWTCGNSNTLVRTVEGTKYEFACPTGTTCKTEGLPYAICM